MVLSTSRTDRIGLMFLPCPPRSPRGGHFFGGALQKKRKTCGPTALGITPSSPHHEALSFFYDVTEQPNRYEATISTHFFSFVDRSKHRTDA